MTRISSGKRIPVLPRCWRHFEGSWDGIPASVYRLGIMQDI